jgi:hypothetical protein
MDPLVDFLLINQLQCIKVLIYFYFLLNQGQTLGSKGLSATFQTKNSKWPIFKHFVRDIEKGPATSIALPL